VPELPALIAFCAAAFAIIVLPGPAVLYIVARSLHQGRLAGVVSATGVAVGGLVHVAAAVLGLSALLVSSGPAFAVVKFAGAGYLIYLGVRTLLARDAADAVGAAVGQAGVQPLPAVFWQGAMVNILNPKTALFFLAFLPQFVDQTGSVPLQTLLLGLLFLSLAWISDGLYGLLAGSVGVRLRGPRVARAQRQLAGGIYLVLGLVAATVGERTA
jgi:threonine/homoserine/homoserine lactone efflux protein